MVSPASRESLLSLASLASLASRECQDSQDTRDSRDTRDSQDSRDTRDSQDTQDSQDTRDSLDSRDTQDSRDSQDTNSILNLEYRITNERSRTPGSIETPDRARRNHLKGNLKHPRCGNCSKQGRYRVFDQIRNAISGARLQFETRSGVKVAE